jgi:hypothetical protein
MAQASRDQSVVDLCKTMADTYSSAKRARVLDKIHHMREIIETMLNQTLECALFIQEYFGCEFGGESLKSSCH